MRRRAIRAGTVAVVTGASAGVGRAIARALGRRGARVGLIARGVDGLEAAARGEARSRSIALWLRRHRGAAAVAAGFLAAVGLTMARRT